MYGMEYSFLLMTPRCLWLLSLKAALKCLYSSICGAILRESDTNRYISLPHYANSFWVSKQPCKKNVLSVP